MSAGLKHNIEAMKRTKQTPSFAQVLVTFQQAADEIIQLEADNARLRWALGLAHRALELRGPGYPLTEIEAALEWHGGAAEG
jgi:hypothetical protein